MSMNSQPSSERTHIAFFGLRNAGKSSLVNAVTGQNLSVVSDVAGTTTDPVKKTMEILPLGPVVIIDTPGIDDSGRLGDERVKRALSVLSSADIAVLVIDAVKGVSELDRYLISQFEKRNIPYIKAFNKADLIKTAPVDAENEIYVSATENKNIYELKELIGRNVTQDERVLCRDLFDPGDVVVLVTPIDAAAPKGRLILPQQQVLRDVLDGGGIAVVTKETELEAALKKLSSKPSLVITDSQAFEYVNSVTPRDVSLTSFSILFARYKGELSVAKIGADTLDSLNDGDTVLISEGCTHHRQCGDIGTVKLPAWINKYTGKDLNFKFTSGAEFPEDLSGISLVVHCGGCMLSPREMKSRISACQRVGVPITNYGIAIAKMHGILDRSLDILDKL